MNPNARRLLEKVKDPTRKLKLLEEWDVRAAIKEWCAGMSREQAEREAAQELEEKVKNETNEG